MTDSDLIQKIHNGDQEAAGILIERYYADIYHFCLYMVQSEEDAYDICLLYTSQGKKTLLQMAIWCYRLQTEIS